MSEPTGEEILKWIDEEITASRKNLNYLINEAMRKNDEARNDAEKYCRKNLAIKKAVRHLIENICDLRIFVTPP